MARKLDRHINASWLLRREKMKNIKAQECTICENFKSKKMWNIKKINAAFENNICKQKYCFYLYNFVEKIIWKIPCFPAIFFLLARKSRELNQSQPTRGAATLVVSHSQSNHAVKSRLLEIIVAIESIYYNDIEREIQGNSILIWVKINNFS